MDRRNVPEEFIIYQNKSILHNAEVVLHNRAYLIGGLYVDNLILDR